MNPQQNELRNEGQVQTESTNILQSLIIWISAFFL
jgi:hypothetical protein